MWTAVFAPVIAPKVANSAPGPVSIIEQYHRDVSAGLPDDIIGHSRGLYQQSSDQTVINRIVSEMSGSPKRKVPEDSVSDLIHSL